jgi:RNA polymerase sigma-70 factor (ECF subfamily)
MSADQFAGHSARSACLAPRRVLLLPYAASQNRFNIRYISETGFREEADWPLKEFDLEEAVRLYSRKLFLYVYTLLCDYHEAEDVVQDAFISAYRGQARFDGENVSAWLYKIAYHKSIDRMRRRKTVSFQELREDIPAAEQDYDAGYSPAVIRALRRLTDEERAILLGRITESLSYAELAGRLHLSEPALRKRYERSKKKLAEYLQETESEAF